MNMSSKHSVVSESLSSFDSLRTALAYLRSISITFGDEKDKLRSVVSEEIKTMIAQSPEDEAEVLEDCYYRATMSFYTALLYAVIKHYQKLGRLNSQLRHTELDRVLKVADDCGLLEKMRQVRNSVFHVRPNKRMETLIDEVVRLAIDNEIEMESMESLLYDFTSDVFSGTEIFQKSEEQLTKGFNDALAYYDEHFA